MAAAAVRREPASWSSWSEVSVDPLLHHDRYVTATHHHSNRPRQRVADGWESASPHRERASPTAERTPAAAAWAES